MQNVSDYPFPMEYFCQDAEYHTPAGSRRWWDRIFLGLPLCFYLKHLGIVVRGGRKAHRGRYDDQAWVASSRETMDIVEGAGGRFHISGLDRLAQAPSPLVFVANHMSTLETHILPMLIAPHMPVTFVVKQALLRYPFFGPILASRRPVAVKRENPREDLVTVLQEGTARLKQGMSVIVFPQSTRSRRFDPELFNTLGVKLAQKAGVPVLPIALKTDFWGNGRLIRDVGPLRRKLPIHFAFGEVMEVKGNGREQHQTIVKFIQEHLHSWE